MSAMSLRTEGIRKDLSEAIMSVLESWPALHRQVFVRSHYRGHSPERISISLGLSMSEVRLILEHCDRKLRAALRAFRAGAVDQKPLSECRSPVFASNISVH